jgi:cytochrome c peroxidase
MIKNRLFIAAITLTGLVALFLAGTVYRSPFELRDWLAAPYARWLLTQGENPYPVSNLQTPPRQELSAMALLGRKIFYDASLSGSGKQSCAACHDPASAFAPGNNLSVQSGGDDLRQAGVRAVPSLTYLYRQQNFSIGPDNPENESNDLQQAAALGALAAHTQKNARNTQTLAANIVPQGGLFWDGRVNTLQQQADGPLFNPLEMNAGSIAIVAEKLSHAAYVSDIVQLFGTGVLRDPTLLVSEALFALARFQIEDSKFHSFTSKYDAWLQGKARFTDSETRGYAVFNDPGKGNCAACHPDKPTREGLPPLFTDNQYEALGLPRNAAIPANRDSRYFDLGLCGPYRQDLKAQVQYCGMFITPSLRNVSTRKAFFHNGVYHTLEEVLNFYDFRDVAPQRIYPADSAGKPEKFNDIPQQQRANVDVTDPPFNRKPGETPAMSNQDMRDVIAFLHTLDDGYMSPAPK